MYRHRAMPIIQRRRAGSLPASSSPPGFFPSQPCSDDMWPPPTPPRRAIGPAPSNRRRAGRAALALIKRHGAGCSNGPLHGRCSRAHCNLRLGSFARPVGHTTTPHTTAKPRSGPGPCAYRHGFACNPAAALARNSQGGFRSQTAAHHGAQHSGHGSPPPPQREK